MQYVVPDTTIHLMSGIPIDVDYSRTLYFASESSQNAYFAAQVGKVLTDYSYQRVDRKTLRVALPADEIRDYNYMRFKNTAHSTKWFYAFITNVEYVNEKTCTLEYKIDVIQSWFVPNGTLGMCYVEREHAVSDEIGENITPEKLDCGDYIFDLTYGSGFSYPLKIVVAATFDSSYNDYGGGLYSGTYTGFMFHQFDNTQLGAQACKAFIEGAVNAGKADGIGSIFLVPAGLIASGAAPISGTITIDKNLYRLGEYTPKNNKLFTYPYNFLYATNFNGETAEYAYENFYNVGNTCEFKITGTLNGVPELLVAPRFYMSNTIDPNYDYKICQSSYPQLAYNTDSFAAWVAANKTSVAINSLTALMMSGAASVATSNPIPIAIGLANTIRTENEIIDKSRQPNSPKTGSGSTSLMVRHSLDIRFYRKFIKPQHAKIIDDYFTMYGYATKRVKAPNISSRPHWNYVKTANCIVNGNIPANVEKEICDIFNNGITFWKNANEVGNYSLDNSPA